MKEKGELKYFTYDSMGNNIPMNPSSLPTSNFTTDAMDLSNYSGKFVIQVNRTAGDGTVSFVIMMSNDLYTWTRYAPIIDTSGRGVLTQTQDQYARNTATNFPLSGSIYEFMLQDQVCIPRYISLWFTVSGSPTGNIYASIYLHK